MVIGAGSDQFVAYSPAASLEDSGQTVDAGAGRVSIGEHQMQRGMAFATPDQRLDASSPLSSSRRIKLDTQTPMIRMFFGMPGIEQIYFSHAEGLALGEAEAERGRAVAVESCTRLAA